MFQVLLYMVGYKYYDEEKTRRSAEVLKPKTGESLEIFIKRCKTLGFEACDPRNVVDHYKHMENELIKGDLEKKRNKNLSILCVNIINDFNIASCIRASNAFVCQTIYIFGNKKYDRRGCVGSYMFENIKYIDNLDSLKILFKEFSNIISVDNISTAKSLVDFKWDFDGKTLLILGQESIGVPGEILELSTDTLYIPQFGSVRSLNVAQACAITLYDYNAKLLLTNNL